MSKNLITRIIVAAIAIPLILWICYRGGDWLFGMVVFFAVLGMYEFLYNEGYRPKHLLFYLTLVILAFMFIAQYDNGGRWFIPIKVLFSGMSGMLVFFILSGIILASGKQEPSVLFTKQVRLFWGLFYIGILYPFVYLIFRS